MFLILFRSKFIEFIKKAKNINSRSFVENLFAFGSQMGILSGNPPKVGFEESLIVLSQLNQTNAIELMKFLFTVGSGGNREIKLGSLEYMLNELLSSENKENIAVLLKSLEFVYSQGNKKDVKFYFN